MTWAVVEGDAKERLAEMEAGSAQCCVTSPPYFGLRDYGVDGQLGLEPTPDAYVAALVDVFREVRRVLADDGTVWLNLGDSYSVGAMTGTRGPNGFGGPRGQDRTALPGRACPPGLKPKDLLGIPWMVAFALRSDGWYLRSDIIWAKPNPMPESVTDRPTKAHEYLFLLSKRARYFYDAEAVKEPASNGAWPGIGPQHGTVRNRREVYEPMAVNDAGRNLRDVWTVATEPFPEAHFATFPKALVEPCIKAGTSEKGVCPECRKPWVWEVEVEQVRLTG